MAGRVAGAAMIWKPGATSAPSWMLLELLRLVKLPASPEFLQAFRTSFLAANSSALASLSQSRFDYAMYGGADITVPPGGVKLSGFGRDKVAACAGQIHRLKTAWISLAARFSLSAAEDEIGAPIGDHDHRRVGVAADETRHDRGVADA